MKNRKVLEALGGLGGEHRAAVVGQQSARQTALEESLGESVDEAFRGLLEVPLGVADEARAVIEDRQQHRAYPLPVDGENLQGAVMKVQVPESTHILGLEAARLAGLSALLGQALALPLTGRHPPAPPPTVRHHVAPQARIGRQRPPSGLLGNENREIVKV